jgi:hypothetical protein
VCFETRLRFGRSIDDQVNILDKAIAGVSISTNMSAWRPNVIAVTKLLIRRVLPVFVINFTFLVRFLAWKSPQQSSKHAHGLT